MNPFAYEPPAGATLAARLARLSAASKAACLVLLSYAAMALPALPLAALAAAAAGAGILGSGNARRAAGIAIGARGIIVLAGAAAAARGLLPGDGRLFAAETLAASALYGLRLVAVYFLGTLYFASTRASELGEAATRLSRKLTRQLRPPAAGQAGLPGLAGDPGILIGMTLRFLPRGFDRYRLTREAAAARGFAPRDFRLGPMAAVLERFAVSSMRDALLTSRAMEARCYDPARTLPEGRFGAADAAAVVISAAIAMTAAVAATIGARLPGL